MHRQYLPSDRYSKTPRLSKHKGSTRDESTRAVASATVGSPSQTTWKFSHLAAASLGGSGVTHLVTVLKLVNWQRLFRDSHNRRRELLSSGQCALLSAQRREKVSNFIRMAMEHVACSLSTAVRKASGDVR